MESPDVLLFTLEGSHLSLTGQSLTVFPSMKYKKVADHALVDVVTSIDASVNRLRDIRSLGEFTQLKQIVLDVNELFEDSVLDLPVMATVESLFMNDNSVQDLNRFLDNVKQKFPNLTTLSLLKNPCCPNAFVEEQKDRYKQYRSFVVSKLPKLEHLDTREISELERQHVKASSHALKVPALSPRGLLSPLGKAVVGFTTILDGELTMATELTEMTPWSPNYFKLGEGTLVYFQTNRSLKPMGTIELKGYKVTVVDDQKIIDFIPAGMEVFSLTNPKKRSYFLIAKNKEDLERWTDALMHQAMEGAKPEEDWDAMEAKKNELIAAKDKLRKRTSELRLAKTINQSNGILSSEVLLGKVLGTGSYGTVYKGTVRSTPVAIKVLHHQEMTPEAYEDFISELEILSKLHHPNIIRFLGATSQPLMILTELMQGDLEHLLLDKKVKLSLAMRFSMARDAALGVAWLHGSDPMIVHRDIKTNNFLYDEHMRVVVSDFGLAEWLRKGGSTWDEAGAFKGTVYYVAPEMFKNIEFNEKSDVYAFGMVLWMIYTREPLFADFEKEFGHLPENEFDDLFRNKVCFEDLRPKIPQHCPLSLKTLMDDCWNSDPSKRPSFEQIVQRLDAAFFEEAIRDRVARQKWVEYFPGKHFATFDLVMEKFGPYFNIESVNDRVMLKELMAARRGVRGAPTAVESRELVTVDSFGTFLDRFGPLSKSHDIVANARRVVSQKYFFGEMSAREAHVRLSECEEGTFLLRFAGTPPATYTISVVARTSIRHYHVVRAVKFGRNPDSFEVDFILDKDGEKASFLSLESCVRRQQAMCQNPAPGYPFSFLQDRVTFKWKGEENDSSTPPNSPREGAAPQIGGESSPAPSTSSRRAAFADKRSVTMAFM